MALQCARCFPCVAALACLHVTETMCMDVDEDHTLQNMQFAHKHNMFQWKVPAAGLSRDEGQPRPLVHFIASVVCKQPSCTPLSPLARAPDASSTSSSNQGCGCAMGLTPLHTLYTPVLLIPQSPCLGCKTAQGERTPPCEQLPVQSMNRQH